MTQLNLGLSDFKVPGERKMGSQTEDRSTEVWGGSFHRDAGQSMRTKTQRMPALRTHSGITVETGMDHSGALMFSTPESPSSPHKMLSAIYRYINHLVNAPHLSLW